MLSVWCTTKIHYLHEFIINIFVFSFSHERIHSNRSMEIKNGRTTYCSERRRRSSRELFSTQSWNKMHPLCLLWNCDEDNLCREKIRTVNMTRRRGADRQYKPGLHKVMSTINIINVNMCVFVMSVLYIFTYNEYTRDPLFTFVAKGFCLYCNTIYCLPSGVFFCLSLMTYVSEL